MKLTDTQKNALISTAKECNKKLKLLSKVERKNEPLLTAIFDSYKDKLLTTGFTKRDLQYEVGTLNGVVRSQWDD